jgi:hypothetical protein
MGYACLGVRFIVINDWWHIDIEYVQISSVAQEFCLYTNENIVNRTVIIYANAFQIITGLRYCIFEGFCLGPESIHTLCIKIRVEAVLYTLVRGMHFVTVQHICKSVRVAFDGWQTESNIRILSSSCANFEAAVDFDNQHHHFDDVKT